MRRLAPVALAALSLACASAVPLPAATVMDWVLGSEHRVHRGPSADAYLLIVQTGKPLENGTRVTNKCIEATSILPAPPRTFFLVKGAVHVSVMPGQEPVLLSGNDPRLGITRLLASTSSPLRLLVAARPREAAAEELWILTLDDLAIHEAQPVTDRRDFTNQSAFFRAYRPARCLPGGRRCLVINTDHEESYLDVEPVRGEPREALMPLGDIDVRDAAWESAEGRSLYLLLGCP